jgi:prephenate dehydrogenase
MSTFQVTIVGLGVTGSSLGLALKKASSDIRIVGHDRDSTAATVAHKAGAVDRTDWNLPSACRDAGIIILALPLSEMRDTLAVIGPELPSQCLVTDTAPLKEPVLAWAKEALPPQAPFVGGNPVGARGAAAPRSDLFAGTTYCLCPERDTPSDAIDRASDLVVAIGATPRFVGAAEHDGLVAFLDHLPLLLAAGALHAASAEGGWRDLTALGSSRLDQLLGALGDSPSPALDAAAANASNVARWLDRMQESLDALRALLAEEPEVRQEAIEHLLEAREEWERRGKDAPGTELDVGFNLRRMFGFR